MLVPTSFVRALMARIYRRAGKTIPYSKFDDLKKEEYYNRHTYTWSDTNDSVIVRIYTTAQISYEATINGINYEGQLFEGE